MSQKIPMIGKRFGRLVVVAEAEKSGTSRSARYICQCDCGNVKSINGTKLRSGETKSCGCHKRDLTIERNFRHGLTHTRIHRIWVNMKTRCYDTNSPPYKWYGAKGVRVCDEWLSSLQSFQEWAMKSGYADNLSIDRIDVNGDYCPENCRWVDMKTQQNNRRNNIAIEINGKAQTISQWAKETGIKYCTIYARYNRGLTGEKLIRKA